MKSRRQELLCAGAVHGDVGKWRYTLRRERQLSILCRSGVAAGDRDGVVFGNFIKITSRRSAILTFTGLFCANTLQIMNIFCVE